MGVFRKYKYLILLVTVPVLLLFMSNSLMNRHSHHVRGYTYSHAHPIKKEPADQNLPFHSHTDAELIILQLLDNIDILVFFILVSLLPLLEIIRSIKQTRTGIKVHSGILAYSLRGPPFFTL